MLTLSFRIIQGSVYPSQIVLEKVFGEMFGETLKRTPRKTLRKTPGFQHLSEP